MARPTKNQIASAALAIAIVGGGGVVYAENTPGNDNDCINHNTTSAPIPDRR